MRRNKLYRCGECARDGQWDGKQLCPECGQIAEEAGNEDKSGEYLNILNPMFGYIHNLMEDFYIGQISRFVDNLTATVNYRIYVLFHGLDQSPIVKNSPYNIVSKVIEGKGYFRGVRIRGRVITGINEYTFTLTVGESDTNPSVGLVYTRPEVFLSVDEE